MESRPEYLSDSPDLFARLREQEGAEVCVRFRIGVPETSSRVDIPATLLSVQGTLRVEEVVERFEVQVPGWGPEDFAWFGRRMGRGGPGYWQGALEYRPEARPAVVLYFTAALDGLEILVQQTHHGDTETQREHGEKSNRS